jgi:hypothetical protein
MHFGPPTPLFSRLMLLGAGASGSGEAAEPVAEVTEINFNECTGFSMNIEEPGAGGRAFLISSATERYAVWFLIDDELQPTVPGATAYIQIPIGQGTGASSAEIGNAVRAGIGAYFTPDEPETGQEHIVRLTDLTTGAREDAADYSTNGAVITVITQGS